MEGGRYRGREGGEGGGREGREGGGRGEGWRMDAWNGTNTTMPM